MFLEHILHTILHNISLGIDRTGECFLNRLSIFQNNMFLYDWLKNGGLFDTDNKKAEELWIQWTAMATSRYADVLRRLISSFSICLEYV